jgi:hypothetical protein
MCLCPLSIFNMVLEAFAQGRMGVHVLCDFVVKQVSNNSVYAMFHLGR